MTESTLVFKILGFLFGIVLVIVLIFIQKNRLNKKIKQKEYQESLQKKIKKQQEKQKNLGMELVRYLQETCDSRKDKGRYIVGYIDDNNKGKYFSVIITDRSFNVDCLQININTSENLIQEITLQNITKNFLLREFHEIKKILANEIRRL